MKKSMSKRLIAIITIVSVVVNNTSLVYANEINKKEVGK